MIVVGANSAGEVAVTGGKLVSQNGTAINLPESASLSNTAARQWYLDQEAQIPSLIDTTTSLQDQAYQAFNLRNSFRTATRNAMIDQETAAQLNVTNPNLTWDQVVQKYSSTYSGDELWTQIIGASQRSRASVNQSFGVTPSKGK